MYPMFNLDEIEKTICNLRTQAQQLNATADALDAWCTPWRNAQKIVSETQNIMSQFFPPWPKP